MKKQIIFESNYIMMFSHKIRVRNYIIDINFNLQSMKRNNNLKNNINLKIFTHKYIK